MLVGCLLPVLIAAYTDARWHLVPDRITLPILIAALVSAVYGQRVPDALLGMSLAGGILLLGAVLGGVGGGDVKLAAGLGLWFGLQDAVIILFIASVFGVIWGLAGRAKAGRLKSWAQTFFGGLYLGVFCGVKGAVELPKLPDNPEIVPEGAVPFGTCLALASWAVFLFQFVEKGGPM